MGVGEGSDALEPFYPDRAASRILGAPQGPPSTHLAPNTRPEILPLTTSRWLTPPPTLLPSLRPRVRVSPGMGDVVSLVEKAARMNQKEIEKLGERIMKVRSNRTLDRSFIEYSNITLGHLCLTIERGD